MKLFSSLSLMLKKLLGISPNRAYRKMQRAALFNPYQLYALKKCRVFIYTHRNATLSSQGTTRLDNIYLLTQTLEHISEYIRLSGAKKAGMLSANVHVCISAVEQKSQYTKVKIDVRVYRRRLGEIKKSCAITANDAQHSAQSILAFIAETSAFTPHWTERTKSKKWLLRKNALDFFKHQTLNQETGNHSSSRHQARAASAS